MIRDADPKLLNRFASSFRDASTPEERREALEYFFYIMALPYRCENNRAQSSGEAAEYDLSPLDYLLMAFCELDERKVDPIFAPAKLGHRSKKSERWQRIMGRVAALVYVLQHQFDREPSEAKRITESAIREVSASYSTAGLPKVQTCREKYAEYKYGLEDYGLCIRANYATPDEAVQKILKDEWLWPAAIDYGPVSK